MLRAASAILATLLLTAMLACLPAAAQEKQPGDFLRRSQPLLDLEPSETLTERPPVAPVDPNAPAKLCFWKAENGTGFGKSGFCEVSNQFAVGTACRCYSGGGRPEFKGAGTVILAPNSSQSSDVVR